MIIVQGTCIAVCSCYGSSTGNCQCTWLWKPWSQFCILV